MVSITTAVAQDFLDTINAAANSGGAPVLRVYGNGSAPADADAAATGTILVNLPMTATTTFAAATGSAGGAASIVANTISAATAVASHDPVYCRVISNGGSGDVVLQLTAGVGSGEVNFGSTIVSGASVTVTSLTVNMPNE